MFLIAFHSLRCADCLMFRKCTTCIIYGVCIEVGVHVHCPPTCAKNSPVEAPRRGERSAGISVFIDYVNDDTAPAIEPSLANQHTAIVTTPPLTTSQSTYVYSRFRRSIIPNLAIDAIIKDHISFKYTSACATSSQDIRTTSTLFKDSINSYGYRV
jgi:hypothetical protein